MILTAANYHSTEANKLYLSNHQFRSWLECAARESAIQAGKYTRPDKESFIIGQYVDRGLTTPELFEQWKHDNRLLLRKDPTAADLKKFGYDAKKGTKEAFLLEHPELRGTGEPYGFIDTAEAMIKRAQRDQMFMNSLDGEHQVVITFELGGVKWKAMLDAVRVDIAAFTDLKTTASLDKWEYDEELKIRVPFYEAFGYWTQFALYARAYEERYGAAPEWAFMSCITKQKETGADEPSPDLGIFLFADAERFALELAKIEERLPQVMRWKNGEEEPTRCEKCEYCRLTKVLTSVQTAENYRRGRGL